MTISMHHEHSHAQKTFHDHPHTHGPEAYDHHHDHVHRHYADIMHMLDEAPLKQEVRALAKKIFRIVGEAESRVHACPLEEVHFHETGAVDSIVDIVGAAACAVDLGITETYVSTIYEGQGHVWCQHGRIPVPAPAVAGIAAAEELDLAITNVSGEMVTPTGAAIAAAFRTKKGLPKAFVIRKIGMGAGKKDFPHANLLRAMIIEPAMNGLPAGNAVEEPTRFVNADGDSQKNGSSAQKKSSSDETEDEIWVLETNLDDCTGEMMGLTMELLLAAGARDVNYTPIYMKKNRPACKLEVLCKEEKVSALEEVIFHQTTAIGLRKRKEVRRILPRKKETVMTPYGEVELKICTSAGENLYLPGIRQHPRTGSGNGPVLSGNLSESGGRGMEEKKERLKALLDEYTKGNACLAFSGGIDSSLILKLAQEAADRNGTKLYAVTFDTVLHPKADREIASRVARENHSIHEIISVDELKQEEIRFNPKNRCYLCKKSLFSGLLDFARAHDAAVVMEGTNQDDLKQYRPGIQAVKELGVKSPLMEAGFTKAEIRAYAKELGISVAERPSSPCLATRLPYGTEIDMALLKRIGEGEEALRNLGLKNVRIRVHGEIARLEVDSASFPAILEQREEVLSILKKVGVPYLTLDLEGFRSGSMDIHVK